MERKIEEKFMNQTYTENERKIDAQLNTNQHRKFTKD